MNASDSEVTRADRFAALVDGEPSAVARTYWFDGSAGLRKAVRDLYRDLRGVGYVVERSSEKSGSGSDLVTTRVENTSEVTADGRTMVTVRVEVDHYPFTVEDWLLLVRLAVRGGFTVSTGGPARVLVLTITTDEVTATA
jgi:hypothetical protein